MELVCCTSYLRVHANTGYCAPKIAQKTHEMKRTHDNEKILILYSVV